MKRVLASYFSKILSCYASFKNMNDDIIKVVPHKRTLYAAIKVKYNWFKFKHENLVYQQTIVDNRFHVCTVYLKWCI